MIVFESLSSFVEESHKLNEMSDEEFNASFHKNNPTGRKLTMSSNGTRWSDEASRKNGNTINKPRPSGADDFDKSFNDNLSKQRPVSNNMKPRPNDTEGFDDEFNKRLEANKQHSFFNDEERPVKRRENTNMSAKQVDPNGFFDN